MHDCHAPAPLSAAPASLHWKPGFGILGAPFVHPQIPEPLSAPYWVARSTTASRLLGLDDAWMASPEALQLFSGNAVIPGVTPWAAAYSGHQFGIWAGQLGDGRALTLGAVQDTDGQWQELQLKGSGLTPFSRMGDGRAVLRSSIREFVASEAMHALGIPTTRALCVTGSSDPVYRETCESAAVTARFAPSFIRFGHFEHHASRGAHEALHQLADHVIDNFMPHCRQATHGNAGLALLEEVVARTARLVAQWQCTGFCHGVMNTDNMSILGLTLDYGPFQFLDAYDPGHICNHSDQQGRYAHDRQPDIAWWNLHALGHALLPLIGDKAAARQALNTYRTTFDQHLQDGWARKLGLAVTAPISGLMPPLLQALEVNRVDFTVFWRKLALAVADAQDWQPVRSLFADPGWFDPWLDSYAQALQHHALPDCGAAMLRTNPAVVPRNHLCQTAIAEAEQGRFDAVQQLLQACTDPYDTRWDDSPYAALPPDWAAGLAISCSS